MRSHHRHGFTLILTSLMLLFIVAVLGVLVDAAVLAAARDRLSEVVQGSAAAAGQAIAGAATREAAEARAKTAALGVTRARFRDGLLGLDAGQIDLNVSCRLAKQPNGRPNGLVDVRVRTELPAPMYFMRLWGVAAVPVSDESYISRRNRVTVLVPADSSVDAGELRRQVAEVAGSLTPYDQIRVIPGRSSLVEALAAGYREVQDIDQPSAANGIVLISTSGGKVTVDGTVLGEAERIRSDARYRIRVGTAQWASGAGLATQLARQCDLPGVPTPAQAKLQARQLPLFE